MLDIVIYPHDEVASKDNGWPSRDLSDFFKYVEMKLIPTSVKISTVLYYFCCCNLFNLIQHSLSRPSISIFITVVSHIIEERLSFCDFRDLYLYIYWYSFQICIVFLVWLIFFNFLCFFIGYIYCMSSARCT